MESFLLERSLCLKLQSLIGEESERKQLANDAGRDEFH